MPLTNLDTLTIMILLFLGNLTVVLILVAYSSGFGQILSYRQFIAGKTLQAISWLLFFFRGDIPNIFSIQIANSLLFAGFTLETLAITNSNRPHHNSEKIFGILGIVSIIIIWLIGSYPSNIRVFIASLLCVAIYATCSLYLLYYSDNSLLRKIIGGLFVLFCLSNLFRAISSFLSSATGYTLFSNNISQTIDFLLLFFIMLISGVGFILLIKEKDDTILKDSESFNRGLVENLPDLIVVYGYDQKIRYVNPAATRIFGYSAHEMEGTDIISYFAPQQQPVVQELIRERVLSGSMRSVEFDIVTRDDKTRTVLSKGVPIQYYTQPAILTILVDITDRKEMERELREKTEEINQYFITNLDLFCIADTNGNFIRLNPEWEKSLGYPLAELEGQRFLDFVHPEDLPATLDAIKDLTGKTEVLNFVNRYRAKDGTYRYIEWRAFPSPDNNLIYAAARDITDRKKYEEKIIKISALKEKLLSYIDIGDLLLRVSDAMVDIFDADFARIWLIKDADLCTTGCIHASETAGSDVCQNRTRCLHLMVSSGRYSAVNGTHQRVPLGCYKVGRLAQGDQTLFITNDVAHDPFVHDHAWAEELGLTSFAGFRLLSPDNTATGVLAFFKKNPLSSPDEALIQELTNTVSHAINAALASQEIRESEAKFKGLFEGANDAIVIMDHSIIVDCNHKTEDLLGLPRERIIGHSPADFAPVQQPDNRSSAGRVQESIDIVLSGGTQRIEWVHKNPDNSLTNTEVSLSRITIHGRFYLLGIIRDITERKEAENVLKKAHTLLESKVRERTAALRESEEKLQLKLNSLLSPDSDLTEMELSNILDIGEVQSLLDNFSHLTGITIAILDLKGNVIEASGWQDICTKFHRVHQKTAEYCTESDLHLSENLQPGQYVSYQCKNHLWDVITPLYISEKHVGNIFTGQFFYDDEIIDESVFIDQAERYGFDREEYLSALHRIPRFSRSYVDTIMEFQVQFTGYISRLSFSNLKLARIMAEENEIREALVQSGQLLSDIINHLPDATLAINLKGEVITWNKAMEEMTGVKAEDIVGKGNYEYAIPLYGYRRPILIDWIFTPCEEVEKEYTVIKLEGNLIVAEVDITLPDGRDISLWGKATPLYDKDGNKVGAIESIRDVTSQKKAIVALQESEDKFRDLSEKSLTGIYLIQDEIFRYVNAKLAEIFEYPVSELTDIMGPKELIIQDDWPKLEENLRKRIEGEIESINYEMRGVTKSGKIIFIEVFGSRTIFKGRPAVIGSLLDITVRKKAEEDLQRLNEELEMRVAQRTAELSKAQGAYQQANKKLHLLSSITRHDINNQLQGMISYLDFSRDYVNDAKKIAGFIEKEMIIADSIYRQISFTKDYEEMGIHSPTWQNVHSIIKASVAQLPVGNIRVTVGDPEIEIFADPLLQKVFYNLIDNALRYGGEKMTMIHTSNYNQEANRIIIVEDDGNGISGEDKKKLFSKGFGKHTGLGLFLSREILSITGITITENGTPGSGARFEITVPQGMFRTEDNS